MTRRREEQYIQASFEAHARAAGWLVFHAFDARRCTPGFPDAVCVRNGRMVCVELKTLTGRVSKAQERWIAEFDMVPGVSAFVALLTGLGADRGGAPMSAYSTCAQVADELGVSTRTVLRWIDRGDLDAVRLPGGRLRVDSRNTGIPPGRVVDVQQHGSVCWACHSKRPGAA